MNEYLDIDSRLLCQLRLQENRVAEGEGIGTKREKRRVLSGFVLGVKNRMAGGGEDIPGRPEANQPVERSSHLMMISKKKRVGSNQLYNVIPLSRASTTETTQVSGDTLSEKQANVKRFHTLDRFISTTNLLLAR